ncbi:hypothetical protein G7Y89_g3639 [Cudoniella acicularis]|uniref:G-patch domain-containing protein n=1 Tax=Cudoniella acicularis TaxID=354080 RepID=A0A8H4RTY6_9HELO|nr:hypothetical protein G7Y89_g3639 [Cudoniella acicularis]
MSGLKRKDRPTGMSFAPQTLSSSGESSPEPEQKRPRPNENAPSTPKEKPAKPSSFSSGSFASRMMAKMGYKEGQGLGKEGQGRSGVIEVVQRPQGVGLGAVREKSKQEIEEEKRQAEIRGEKYVDSDEEKRKSRRKVKSGTSTGSSTPRRTPKPKYQTVNEAQRAAPGLHIPDAFAPILDMSAPTQRFLTSTSGLLTPTAGFETTEESETKKIARRAQKDLSDHVEEWKSLDERKAYIGMEILQERQRIAELQKSLDQFSLFVDTTQDILQASKDSQWDAVLSILEGADNFDISGVNEELRTTVVAAAHPFLSNAIEGWQPLEDPTLGGMTSQLSKIQHILGATPEASITTENNLISSHRKVRSTTAYESMIYKIIFPKIVSAINQGWDVHNPAPLQKLLDSWKGLLPAFVLSLTLDQAVVGKLDEAVSTWNPKKRRSHELPHLWLFPWLPYLSPHHSDPRSSTGLVTSVKRKFRQLIDTWDYRKGVIPGLSQWRDLLCRGTKHDQWTPLIMNHVLPSMSRFLKNEHNFKVDPTDQELYLSALQGIVAWEPILGTRIIGQVITETVFPMWHNVLYQWLTVVGPNEEIGQWFEWWRDSVFPEDIQNLKMIQEEFTKGHEMINQALDLGSKASTHLSAPTSSTPLPSTQPILPTPNTPKPQQPIQEETTFKHLIEDWCIENDLQLLPEKKVLHSAGPLYRVTAAGNGKNGTLVYFKGDSLWAITRKGKEGGQEQVEVRIEWESADARDALLEMAWRNVK